MFDQRRSALWFNLEDDYFEGRQGVLSGPRYGSIASLSQGDTRFGARAVEVSLIFKVVRIASQPFRVKQRPQATIESFIVHMRRALVEWQADKDCLNTVFLSHIDDPLRVFVFQRIVQRVPA